MVKSSVFVYDNWPCGFTCDLNNNYACYFSQQIHTNQQSKNNSFIIWLNALNRTTITHKGTSSISLEVLILFTTLEEITFGYIKYAIYMYNSKYTNLALYIKPCFYP